MPFWIMQEKFTKAKEMEKQQIKDAYNEGEFNQRL